MQTRPLGKVRDLSWETYVWLVYSVPYLLAAIVGPYTPVETTLTVLLVTPLLMAAAQSVASVRSPRSWAAAGRGGPGVARASTKGKTARAARIGLHVCLSMPTAAPQETGSQVSARAVPASGGPGGAPSPAVRALLG